MSDHTELAVIAEELDQLKDKRELSNADINRLMVIAGTLTGILRGFIKDENTIKFIERADKTILDSHNIIGLFYIIPITIELLGNIYSRNPRGRPYRRYKRKCKAETMELEQVNPDTPVKILEKSHSFTTEEMDIGIATEENKL